MHSATASTERSAVPDWNGARQHGHESLRSTLLRGALLGLAVGITDAFADRRPIPTAGLLRAAVLGATYTVVERVLELPPLVSRLGAPLAAAGALAERVPAERSRSLHSSLGPADRSRPFRQLNAGAAALSFSVFVDSALEHYRGGYYNPAMYIAPTVSALTLAASTASALQGVRRTRAREVVFGAATFTGLIGLGFHTYNISRRIGGWSWENLFYGAPLAAPLGIASAGLLGLAASRMLAGKQQARTPTLLGRPAGPLLAAGSALGLLGTAAEAGLLHFRGAFHDPFMFLPVTIPPLTAGALGLTLLHPTPGRERWARALLRSTVAMGFVGMGFHAYGVQRNMGGWYNWSQNLLAGPPLPAPPSFTGMALAGLAGLSLLSEAHHG
jgi:hypothetical protein